MRYQPTGLVGRVFTNELGDQSLIPGQVIWKTQKMVLDAASLNTQYYKVRIPYTSNEKKTFRSPLTMVTNFTYLIIIHKN